MRFTGVVRLRFVGDKDACQRYIPQARTILGEVWNRDIVLGELQESWRRVRLADTVVVSVVASRLHPPIVEINVEAPPDATPPPLAITATLRWEPEGILLTPVTKDNREGWGLPSRTAEGAKIEDALGTLKGALPQVLLNKFENNKYLDIPKFVEWDLPGEEYSGFAPEDYVHP